MKSSKHEWIGKAIGYLLTAAFVVAMGVGLITMAINDQKIDSDQDSSGEVIELPRTELGNPAFEIVAENAGYILYADKRTGEMAVFDRAKETTWYSNPQDRAEDVLCYDKTILASQLILSYVNLDREIDTQVNTMYGSAQVSGVTSNAIDGGIEFVYDFPELGFTIPLAYALTEDGFTAQIDANRIKENLPDQYKLLSISVLPFYGAGSTQDEGYLFVPDGSGALIEYNNGKQTSQIYSAPVYGADMIVQEEKQAGVTESIRMPVFGLKTNNTATVGVITSGESLGQISASVSRKTSSYNQAYAELIYRRREITKVTKGSRNYNMSQYTECLLKEEPFTVRYFLLYDEDANYSGMARCYREYLLDNDLVNRSELVNDYSLLMELYGAVQQKQDEFSLKTDTVLELTSYTQAIELCEKLRNAGVDVTLSMKGWTSGGLGNTAPDCFTPEKVLGGKKGFASLTEYVETNGITAFFEQDFMTLYKNGGDYVTNRDGIGLLIGSTAPIGRYNYDNYELDKENSWYLLTPVCVQDAVSKFTASLADSNIRNVAIGTLGNTLYSDYNKNHYTSRAKAQQIIEACIEELDTSVNDLLVSEGNAYTFKGADIIVDAPVTNSRYDMIDSSVPFYQMVLHGLVPMTVPSCNLSSDSRYLYLKAAETGSLLKYTWIAEDVKQLMDTDYNDLFGVGFDAWFEDATTEYKNMKEDLSALSALQILRHEEVAEGVYKTTYEGNTSVVVNYNETAVTYGGQQIAAESYEVIKEGEIDAQ